MNTTKSPTTEETSYQMKCKRSTDPFKDKWPGLREDTAQVDDGMEITWNVPVVVRNGAMLYVDVFHPANHPNDEALPIILTYSPSGKHGPKTFDTFPSFGVLKGSV